MIRRKQMKMCLNEKFSKQKQFFSLQKGLKIEKFEVRMNFRKNENVLELNSNQKECSIDF